MTMIEKMARAMGMVIYERDGPEKAKNIVDRCWKDWIPEAKAALAAMLEPSQAMVFSGEIAGWDEVNHMPAINMTETAYRAMIQAALDEKEG